MGLFLVWLGNLMGEIGIDISLEKLRTRGKARERVKAIDSKLSELNGDDENTAAATIENES